MKPIQLTERFVRQLQSQCDYIRIGNPVAAQQVQKRVLTAIERLGHFPDSGAAWKRRGTRELVIPGLPFVVIYRVDNDAVIVLSLLHTSREARDVH